MERASELTRNIIFSSVSKSIAVKSGKARLECEYLLPDTSYREKRRFWRMRRKHGEFELRNRVPILTEGLENEITLD